MRIFITGSSGVIDSALLGYFFSIGHNIFCGEPSYSEDNDSPLSLPLGLQAFIDESPLEAVIHTGSDPLPSTKWRTSTAIRAYEEQIQTTRALAEYLASQKFKPRVFIVFSNSGYYGDRDDRVLIETSFVGQGIHAEMCQQLEIATNPARQAGIRVVLLRIARVIGPHGDPHLKYYLPGQKISKGLWGNGKQYVSWISTQDAIEAINYILEKKDISGPVNLTSPNPLSNIEFTRQLWSGKKHFFAKPMPTFMVKNMFDEITASILLSSCRISPRKLLMSGFSFKHSTLDTALDFLTSSPT